MLRTIWTRWTAFAQKVADFQTRLILTIVYFVILAPFGLMVTVFRDPLRVKRPPEVPQWIPRAVDQPTLEYGRRQF
jgi:hypothetical protein